MANNPFFGKKVGTYNPDTGASYNTSSSGGGGGSPTYSTAEEAEAAGLTLTQAQKDSLAAGAATQQQVNANNAAGLASALAGETGLSPERIAELQAMNAGGDFTITASSSNNKWVDPATGQETPPGIGMPQSTTSAGTQISNEADLQAKRDELGRAGVKESDFNKFISSPDAQGRLFFKQPATLYNPATGEQRVVATGSQEANRLLKTGFNLGTPTGDGAIGSPLLTEESGIITADGPTPGSFETDAVVAGASATAKSTDEQIKRNQELLTPPETEKSKLLDELNKQLFEDVEGLTGRGQAQLEEERRRGIEEKTAALNAKNTELKTKLAEINALTSSYNLENQREEGRPQTLSSLRGAQGQNYKMYLAQKNALAADAGILQAELLGMQGELSSAQAAADRAVDLLYQDRLASYNAKLSQAKILESQVNEEESRYLKAVQLTLQQQADALAESKQAKRDILDIKLKAISAGITDSNVLTSIGNAKSLNEAIQLLGTNIPAPVVSGSGGGGGDIPTPGFEPISFEEYLAQSEEEALRSFSGTERQALRAEYDTLVQQATAAQVAPEVQNLVTLVNAGRLTEKQAIDEVSKGNKDALFSALATTPPAPSVGDTLESAIARQKSQQALDLKTHKGLNSSVGTTFLGRIGIADKLTGQKQDFIASTQQLVSGLSLEALIEAKSRGATFGALSDTEMQILASAATKIGTWAIRDKGGNIKGYNTSQSAMRKELDNISQTLLRGQSPERQVMPDGTVWEQQPDGTYLQVE